MRQIDNIDITSESELEIEREAERCVVLRAQSTLNWPLSERWIRPGLNTFTLKGPNVPCTGNLLQERTLLIPSNNNNNSLSGRSSSGQINATPHCPQ